MATHRKALARRRRLTASEQLFDWLRAAASTGKGWHLAAAYRRLTALRMRRSLRGRAAESDHVGLDVTETILQTQSMVS